MCQGREVIKGHGGNKSDYTIERESTRGRRGTRYGYPGRLSEEEAFELRPEV